MGKGGGGWVFAYSGRECTVTLVAFGTFAHDFAVDVFLAVAADVGGSY